MSRKAILVIAFALLLSTVVLAEEESKETQAVNALMEAKESMQEMANKGLTVTSINDTILEAEKELYGQNYTTLLIQAGEINETKKREQAEKIIKALQEGMEQRPINYDLVMANAERVKLTKERAYEVNYQLTSLKLRIDSLENINLTEETAMYAEAESLFKDEMYDEAEASINEAFVAVSKKDASTTELKLLYAAGKENITTYIKSNWKAILITICILAAISSLTSWKASKILTRKKLRNFELEKEILNKLIEETQTERFIDGSITREEYEIKTVGYKERLIDIEKQIPTLMAKLGMNEKQYFKTTEGTAEPQAEIKPKEKQSRINKKLRKTSLALIKAKGLFKTAIANWKRKTLLFFENIKPKKQFRARITEITIPRLPKIKVPRIRIPKIRLPKLRMPRIRIPEIRLPRIRIPKIRIPSIKLPKISLPRIRMPKIGLPRIRKPALPKPFTTKISKLRLPQAKAHSLTLPQLRLTKATGFKPTLPKEKVPKRKLELPHIKIPKITLPKIRMPELPKIRIPRIRIPSIKLPKIRIPNPLTTARKEIALLSVKRTERKAERVLKNFEKAGKKELKETQEGVMKPIRATERRFAEAMQAAKKTKIILNLHFSKIKSQMLLIKHKLRMPKKETRQKMDARQEFDIMKKTQASLKELAKLQRAKKAHKNTWRGRR